jgi:large subunit ribosomal protein L4
MPKVDIYDITGKVVGKLDLKDEVFGIEVNEDVLHASVVNQLANKRQGTQSALVKSEVSGGGRKPWRQKGTGRARQGSTRSAQWKGGGVIFAPKPRDYSYALPKKVRRLALKSALSSKVRDNEIIVLDQLVLDEVKTKEMVSIMGNLNVDSTSLLVLAGKDRNVELSARNIPGVKTSYVNTINAYDILKYHKFIVTKDAVKKIEEAYA